MNSRERVRTALNHREPDKVPIDFGGFMTAINFTNILTFIAIFTWVAGVMVKNRKFSGKLGDKIC